MIEKLIQNNKIIINSDIDGVISGLLLSNFCNCEVVGFSNSADKVWLDTSKCNSIYDGVYIDMFVPNESTITIDQHIIAINKEHIERIQNNPNKINPNIYNQRYLLPTSSYYKKYPFGTCHYIISELCKHGINLSNIGYQNLYEELRFMDFLLRADNTMYTTVIAYKENAKEWWNWLYKTSGNSEIIMNIITYLNTLNPNVVNEIKRKLTDVFLNTYNCSSTDGGFKEIADENGEIKYLVKEYINFISKLSKLNSFNFDLKLIEYKGEHIRTSLTASQQKELIQYNQINGRDVFSYAIVKSINKPEYFSYTIMDCL
ncbi:MAG: hypothetical protein WC951_00740 [Bacteroidales bacterium]